MAKKSGNQDKFITGNGIKIRWKVKESLYSKTASHTKVSLRTIKSLVTVCINGQTVENTAAGGIKVSSMAMESLLTTEAKVNTASGKRALVVLGSTKKLSNRYSLESKITKHFKNSLCLVTHLKTRLLMLLLDIKKASTRSYRS